MLPRQLVQIGGFTVQQNGPNMALDQVDIQDNATAGSATLTAQQVMAGVLNRTGPGAGFTDTWPSADQIIAAMENPQVGDSWPLVYRNGVAFAMTFAAGTGIVAGIGTLTAAASVTRHYRHTILSNKRTAIGVVSTTNANAVLTNVPKDFIKNVMPGMGATGTGIGASAVVLGVSEEAQTITLSVNSTATADNIAVTFFPRVRLDSVGVMTN